MLAPDEPVATCWAVCLDTETRRAEVSLWIIVNGELEVEADAVARESADGLDAENLLKSLTDRLTEHMPLSVLAAVQTVLSKRKTD